MMEMAVERWTWTAMNLKTNHKDSNGKGDEERFSVSSTAFLRWRSPMLIGICFFGLTLVTIEVEGQSPASVPASAAGVAQPPPVPSTVPATPNNVATTSEQPGDDQDTIFVFKAEVQGSDVARHRGGRAAPPGHESRPARFHDVFEDGVRQATTSFHRDDVPVAMGIVIDNSGLHAREAGQGE
jgi:hypothetical protein